MVAGIKSDFLELERSENVLLFDIKISSNLS